MSTQQAEEVLRHTFKELEKMLDDLRRRPQNAAPERKTTREKNHQEECGGRSGKKGGMTNLE